MRLIAEHEQMLLARLSDSLTKRHYAMAGIWTLNLRDLKRALNSALSIE